MNARPRRLPALCLAVVLCAGAHAQKPEVFLLNTYDGAQDVAGWVMSEKLDGVRGVWDGARLVSRNGNAINAPAWFTENFPPFALDGELWTRRGEFETIVSIVRREVADERWRRVQYHVFEAPRQAGGLLQRLSVVEDFLREHPVEHLKVIAQFKIKRNDDLKIFLDTVTAGGGEGVVVRDPNVPYQTGRLSSALKVKNFLDAECVVTKILPGKGKYQGLMGAVECKLDGGERVKIGSGFTDAARADPPPVGSVVTFKYYGLTANGKPRFPVFLRRR